MEAGLITLIFVVLLRLLVPLIIFKKPLLGSLLCILADISDVMLFDYFGTVLPGKFYHGFDKVFDLYYLTIQLIVALRFKDELIKKILKFLYFWRLGGVVLFEFLTLMGIKFRPILVLAPNIFEYYFLAYLITLKFNKKFKMTKYTAVVYFVIIAIPKIIHEMIFHWLYQDKTWHFLRDTFLSSIYH